MSGNRPPVCFKCNQEGHFVINCPNTAQTPASLGVFSPGISKGRAKYNNKGLYKPYYFNKHKDASSRHPFKKLAIVTKFLEHNLSHQSDEESSTFTQPPTPYQQFGPTYTPQPFTLPYQQNQHFGRPGPQYPPQHQTQQQYAPPAAAQYGPGYQPQPYNQYPTVNGPPQFNGNGYQNSYRPPQPQQPPYPQSQNIYHAQNGNFGQTPIGPLQTTPNTWNTPPATSHAHPYQGPQRSFSDSSFHSATPVFHSQPQQGFVERSASYSYSQTPGTPVSNGGGAPFQTPKPLQGSPKVESGHSKASNISSTPYARLGALDNDVIKEIKPEPLPSNEVQKVLSGGSADQKEEGEVNQEDEEEETFIWELEAIFMEAPKLETVALAQPLSTNFSMTPVPLIGPIKNSISRYARSDNLKEFIRPITAAPQWSYLKEDPAFAELKPESLIPLSEVPNWIIERHSSPTVAEEPPEPEHTRKRSRSSSSSADHNAREREQEGQMEVDEENAVEAVTDSRPSKRIKSEFEGEEKLTVPTTVHVTSPINKGRGGTPCLPAQDDAWAPDPDETAATPMSPTEMLLASLGVTGVAKPQELSQEESHVSNQSSPKESRQESQSNGPSPNSATNKPAAIELAPNAQLNRPAIKTNQNGTDGSPQGPPVPPLNAQFVNNQNQPPTYGPPSNQPYTNAPQGQFAPPNASQNGTSVNIGYGSTQYPSQPYGQQSQQNGAPQFGPPIQQNWNQNNMPPMNTPFGNGPNGQYGSGPQEHNQYGNGPPHNAPYNGQHYNQAPQYNAGPTGPFVQQGNPQWTNGAVQGPYGSPQNNAQWGHGPHIQQPYGPQSYSNYPQFGNGPPNQHQFGPPHGPPNFGNGPPYQHQNGVIPQGGPQYNGYPAQQQYGETQQGPLQFITGPPQQQQHYGAPPHNNAQFASGPPNQQKWDPQEQPQFPDNQQYAASEGNPQYTNGPLSKPPHSYNSGPQGNGSSRQDSGYISAQGSYSSGPEPNGLNSHEESAASNQQPSTDDKQASQEHQKEGFISEKNSEDDDQSSRGSLSPNSREILGKLNVEPKTTSGRRSEAKPKRPAPVVEAAYSRRW